MKQISLRTILLTTLLIVLVALPGIFPYGLILPNLTNRLSEALGSRVSADALSFSYLPTPQFTLHGIAIDAPDQASIAQAIVPVSARNILSVGRAIYGIRLVDTVITPQFARELSNRLPPRPSAIHIGGVTLENTSIRLAQEVIGPFPAQLEFSTTRQIEKVELYSADMRAHLQIQPGEANTFKLQFTADHWTPPTEHPINFEYLQLSGETDATGIKISDIRAGLYNGLVTGSGTLDWSKNWLLNARIQAKNVRAEPLISVFSSKTRASGTLAGEGSVQYQAEQLTQLLAAPALQGSFRIQDGALHNIDLINPLKSPVSNTAKYGGQTRFDQFSGNLSVRGSSVSLRKLQLDARQFHASGELSVRDGQISGGTNTSLNAGALRATSQARLSGTLDEIALHPGDTWRPLAE